MSEDHDQDGSDETVSSDDVSNAKKMKMGQKRKQLEQETQEIEYQYNKKFKKPRKSNIGRDHIKTQKHDDMIKTDTALTLVSRSDIDPFTVFTTK